MSLYEESFRRLVDDGRAQRHIHKDFSGSLEYTPLYEIFIFMLMKDVIVVFFHTYYNFTNVQPTKTVSITIPNGL